MLRLFRAGVDFTSAALLAGVLFLVYKVDQTGPPPPLPEDHKPKLKLAVTRGAFDNMGELLKRFGEGYEFKTIDEAALIDPKVCNQFAAIFLTCTKLDASDPTSGAPVDRTVLANALREFVAQGGTLYASDLQYETLAVAFASTVDKKSVALGEKADKVVAEVVHPDLRKRLGAEMPLHFDQEDWRPAAFGGPAVTVYLKGSFKIKGQVTMEAPLLVKFPHGKGTVIFTSFHNEKNNNDQEIELLRYLVLSTVTANAEARVNREMVRGGFSPAQTNLLSAKKGDPSETLTFHHDKPGPLKFTLGFEDQGGILRLELVSPDGKTQARRGGSTLTIDVPNAGTGTWKCIATAEKVPFPNFPFALTVGQQSDPTPPSPAPTPKPPYEKVEFKEILAIAMNSTRSGQLRLGVTESTFDNIGDLLKKLRKGYEYETVRDAELLDPRSLDRFDVLFLPCSAWPQDFQLQDGNNRPTKTSNDKSAKKNEMGREGIKTGRIDPEKRDKVGRTLREFVSRGGTLYASDYRAEMVYAAFGDREPFVTPNLGILPDVEAAERTWIRAMVETKKIGAVAEILRQASLSKMQQQEDNFKLLVAVVENSSLVDGGLAGPKGHARQMVADELKQIRPPLPETDVRAIADALERWESTINEAYNKRTPASKARAKPKIDQALAQLRDLRRQLFYMPKGKGSQTVTTSIVDTGLRDALGVGETIPVWFDQNAWFPARFRGEGITVLMEGRFQPTFGGEMKEPLLVKFAEGQGTVIFTSFHNEQNKEQEEALIRYLVFTTMTAKGEAVATKEMLKGGFSPAKRNLKSHTPGEPSVPSSYHSTKPGRLRFALSFPGAGARFRFNLLAPNKQDKFEKDVDSPIIVETTDAPAGEWLCTVTALSVPHDNFPFTVNVAELTPAAKAP